MINQLKIPKSFYLSLFLYRIFTLILYIFFQSQSNKEQNRTGDIEDKYSRLCTQCVFLPLLFPALFFHLLFVILCGIDYKRKKKKTELEQHKKGNIKYIFFGPLSFFRRMQCSYEWERERRRQRRMEQFSSLREGRGALCTNIKHPLPGTQFLSSLLFL